MITTHYNKSYFFSNPIFYQFGGLEIQHQDYSFSFSLFAKKVQMFHWNDMGIVVEKEPDVICIYGTNNIKQ